jgi:L-lactate dehydrogenase complex protein LldF
VYNNVGGHAYGWAYSGPIGAILSPQLLGTRVARDLPYASSLCGACAEVCPVKIPIPEILLHLRHRVAEQDAVAPVLTRIGARLGSRVLRAPFLYRAGAWLAQIAQKPIAREGWLRALPPPFRRWTQSRPLIAFGGTFRAWWKNRREKDKN